MARDLSPSLGSREQSVAPRAERAAVWIVDDSQVQAEGVRRALGNEYAVTVFHSGATMLEALALETAPNLLVLDWHMPVLSGSEVCKFVREHFDAALLPILILTATGTDAQLLEGLASGANDFLRSPFAEPELRGRVSSLLRTGWLHAALADTERRLRVEAEFRERLWECRRTTCANR